MLKEQVAVHRTEFAELEASTTRKISEQQLLLASERDKVCLHEAEFSHVECCTGHGAPLTARVLAPLPFCSFAYFWGVPR